MEKPRQNLVAEFVLSFFAGKPRTPAFNSVTRAEVCGIVLESLLNDGCFPPNASMVDGDPPMYFGEQIRKLADDQFIVANVEFFAHSSPDGSSTRQFNNATDAVSYYVRDRISNLMHGVSVL